MYIFIDLYHTVNGATKVFQKILSQYQQSRIFYLLRKTFPHHKHLFLLYTQTVKISADANELIYIFHKA